MTLIATSLALLAIAAGLLLLDKTRKESLGNLFKISSWLIIVVGFLCLACVGARGFMHCGRGGSGCGMEKHCGMMQERCGDMQMNCHEKRMKGCGDHGMMGAACHKNMGGGSCCASSEEKSCTKKVVEKDSVVIKE